MAGIVLRSSNLGGEFVAKTARIGSLDISEDFAFQRRQWRLETAGLMAMTLVAAVALTGLLGPGPLSDTTSATPNRDVSTEYERFLRLGAPTDLTIDLNGGAGPAEVSMPIAYLDGFQVDAISPEPDSQTPRRDRLVLSFEDPSRPTQVTVSLTPREIGLQRGLVEAEGRSPVRFTQLVYP